MTLVKHGAEGGKHSYYYRMEFKKGGECLQRFDFNSQNKLTGFATEDGKVKPAAGARRK